MASLFLVAFCLIIGFGMVVFFGPPYVPTLRKPQEAALDLLDLKPGQLLLELGAGDGKVVKAAAQRGLRVVGVELNPFLVLFARARCWKYRRQVQIIWGNYWKVQWPRETDAIFTFMLPKYMTQLDKTIQKWHSKPLALASFAFFIPDRTPDAQRDGVFLYRYK